jgi:NodT family efflux transporter outer membrane factor (OMF) lipoprotein
MSEAAAVRWGHAVARRWVLALAALAVFASGCTPLKQWVHNGFKVGPNFETPNAVVATNWIDAADPHLNQSPPVDSAWWNVFRDPALNSLIETAYRQNLDLKTVGTRVLQAQAQRNMDVGNLFPQSQNANADYVHAQISKNLNIFNTPRASFPTNVNIWATGFNASWELDVWGKIRRTIESANAERDASIEAYHDALVTLTADVASNYIQIRTVQQRMAYARHNVQIQRGTLRLAEARLKEGKATALDVMQARSSLAQTESTIPPLVISLRQASNRLSVLLGLPPHDLTTTLGEASIPRTPPEIAVGIPAQLLERRPDVRRALSEAAAQSARIGYAASDIRRLFAEKSFTGLIIPTFSWKILNYGRVLNNVRNEDARLHEEIFQYQQTVLEAGREVEDALVGFVQYQLQAQSLEDGVKQAQDAVVLVQAQYQGGLVDFNRVFTTQSQLLAQQDQLAIARGNIASSLVAVYRALGGGWQCIEHHTPLATR